MPLEIERKFLVCGDFKSQSTKKERITQGYLSSDPECTVRVRVKGDKAFFTIKGKSDEKGLVRTEWEKEISTDDAEKLFTLCNGKVLDKIRYYVPVNNKMFEVDEFLGENEGLIVAEIELDSVDEDFEKPAWLGQEVTGDIRFYNSQLVTHPYSKWQMRND
ncbi:CYTH domain-containing protein [Dysgonomonas sp. 520]|uniref:CYTH domain-containing protein n=1 Tax=Dysgonomonas sp. 520 TaxID=2302931 RepID=UPI0013D8C51F|nr:CYTH domain-containing protein [Dysgonomonas sp. 520]NDW10048.1 CYTH domain-containing protein [Dysgonomonas sp. 520]